jgi:hypothetical protein
MSGLSTFSCVAVIERITPLMRVDSRYVAAAADCRVICDLMPFVHVEYN